MLLADVFLFTCKPNSDKQAICKSHSGSPAQHPERRLMLALEDCLRDAPGSWRVTVAGVWAMPHHWLLDIVRLEDRASKRVLMNGELPNPAEPLRRVLAALSSESDA